MPVSLRDQQYTFVLDEKVSILVTDDDPIMREFACVYLSTPTASVETAENGEVGLKRLLSGQFDIALVDLDMPVMNGFELIQRICSDKRIAHMPIVVVTSNEDIVSIDRAYRLGATSFVTKPVNWRLLTYQLRYVLRAHGIIGHDRPTSQVA
jgi:DNA-binding response OmpR family regulator